MTDEIVGLIIFGLEWGVALTLIVGVMVWGVRSVIGLIQQSSQT